MAGGTECRLFSHLRVLTSEEDARLYACKRNVTAGIVTVGHLSTSQRLKVA